MTMGSRNVTRVALLRPGELDPRFKDMSDRSALVLLVMASMSLDNDGTNPARHYFGGWHRLANALGFPNANVDSAGRKAVQRSLRDLRERGIVQRVGKAETAHRASHHVYALDL